MKDDPYSLEELGYYRRPEPHPPNCGCCARSPIVRRQTVRGDTIIFPVQVQRPVPGGGGLVPQDITGWELWCTLKRTLADPDGQAVAQVTSVPTSVPPGGGIDFITPTIGLAQVTIPAVATRGFPNGIVTLFYDVQAKDVDGNIFTVERGLIEVEPDVTNSIGG